MTTRTERTDEIFWTVIAFAFTAVCYLVSYMLWADGKIGLGIIAIAMAIAGTAATIAGIYTILMHRFAEQRMREMQREKEGKEREENQ